MRRLAGAAALCGGCFLLPEGNGDERAVCEQWLDCVTAIEPEAAAAAVALYGADSACWGSSDDAARCATACEESLADAFDANRGEPACAPEDVDPTDASLLDGSVTWGEIEVAIDGTCQPVAPIDAITTAPTEGGTFELDLYFSGANPQTLVCTPDGLDFTCDDRLDGPVYVDVVGGTDAAVSTLTVAFDIGASANDLCARWTFTANRM